MSSSDDLFRSLDPPVLRGSRCRRCGTVVFPAASSCPRDGGDAVDAVDLPRAGVVWSWTIQTYEPRPPWTPPPGGFEPFAVGYIDLGPVIIETRMAVPEPELHIGMDVELSTLDIPNPDGGTTTVPQFVPARTDTEARP